MWYALVSNQIISYHGWIAVSGDMVWFLIKLYYACFGWVFMVPLVLETSTFCGGSHGGIVSHLREYQETK